MRTNLESLKKFTKDELVMRVEKLENSNTRLTSELQELLIETERNREQLDEQMVKIWFDDMEEMFQIKLSEWEKLKDNALPPYNNHSEHLKADNEEWEWGSDASDLEYMYHRIKVWREGYGK